MQEHIPLADIIKTPAAPAAPAAPAHPDSLNAVKARPYGESEVLARLTGSGLSLVLACKKLDIPLALGQIYAKSPLYKHRVEQIKQLSDGDHLAQFEQALESELLNNVTRLIALRDGCRNENTALSATNAMLALTPSLKKKAQAQELIQIVLQAEAVANMREALATYRGVSPETIDAEFFPVSQPRLTPPKGDET